MSEPMTILLKKSALRVRADTTVKLKTKLFFFFLKQIIIFQNLEKTVTGKKKKKRQTDKGERSLETQNSCPRSKDLSHFIFYFSQRKIK